MNKGLPNPNKGFFVRICTFSHDGLAVVLGGSPISDVPGTLKKGIMLLLNLEDHLN